MYRFLITGAQFNNKGAQSMLFITVDEIRKRFPGAEIYYFGGGYEYDKYTFGWIIRNEYTLNVALGGWRGFRKVSVAIAKDIVKLLIGRKSNLWRAKRMFEFRKIMPSITAVIDISGFNIGEKWSDQVHVEYMDIIRIAQKYKKPIYLMPQSFGPFNYGKSREWLIEEMKEVFPYASVIYAREEDGQHALEDTLMLKNVRLSTDLVLQNKGVDYSNIYLNPPELNIPHIDTVDNVGVIPNNQCFKFGSREVIIDIYCRIIQRLLNNGKNVYLFRHSVEDYEYCELLKSKFSDDGRVYLLDNDFSCLEYDRFIRNFDFIICSRFHGIVHAYRNGVPCVALGWAVKYQELTRVVNQGQYAIDITEGSNLAERTVAIVDDMMANYSRNSELIRKAVLEIQKDNCFDILDELKES